MYRTEVINAMLKHS